MKTSSLLLGALVIAVGTSGLQARRGPVAPGPLDHRIVATNKTSTMEKELNAGADAGFRFQAVMGGETAMGGKEVVAVMSRPAGGTAARYQYRLLATSKTSTMEKELKAAAEAGYEYRGQTVYESTFAGKEVVVILEKDRESPSGGSVYRLQATSKTSTMEKELKAIGEEGYEVVGLTVAQTALGGKELVAIARKAK